MNLPSRVTHTIRSPSCWLGLGRDQWPSAMRMSPSGVDVHAAGAMKVFARSAFPTPGLPSVKSSLPFWSYLKTMLPLVPVSGLSPNVPLSSDQKLPSLSRHIPCAYEYVADLLPTPFPGKSGRLQTYEAAASIV